MPKFENRITTGNVAQLLALLATVISVGIAIGNFSSRLDRMEEIAVQSVSDSRTLIELRTDVAYIRRSLDRMESNQAVIHVPNMCPDDQPILVASHCRSTPGG